MFVTFNNSVVKDDHKNQQGFIVFQDTLRKKYFMRKNCETFTKYEFLTVVRNHGSSFIFIFAEFVIRKRKAS